MIFFFKEKLSKPHTLQKISPHMEMLKPLVGTTDIRKHLFRQAHTTSFSSAHICSSPQAQATMMSVREVSLTHLHGRLCNSCKPRRLVHVISFLPAQITIIRMVNDWEFKFCFFISNH